jgi:hypothetical protein
MLALVIVLAVTNVATLGVLFYVRARPGVADGDDSTDPAVRSVLAATPAPVTAGATRRIISVEVLNPIELAATRGRVIGIAGSLAPGITRRIVHEQIVKTLRAELADKQVVAEVHLHAVRPSAVPPTGNTSPLDVQPVSYVDEVDDRAPRRAPDPPPR